MSQEFATPVIQQPQKLKKKFCFATIPFLIVALFNLYDVIWSARNILFNFRFESASAPIELIRNLHYVCIFIAAVFISVLLFSKKNNFLLGIPMLIISAGYMMLTFSYIISVIFNYYGWRSIIYVFVSFFAALAFLVVSIYIFIVTSRKKPVSKALCIIPAVLFSLFIAPFAIYAIIELFIYGIYPHALMRNFTPTVLFFAVILLLIWVTSPYKKNKSNKVSDIQPAPAAAPIMPINTANETTVEPEIMHQFVSPVQPVVEAKPEDAPERTLDYCYAEEFYPPVNMPAEKPEVKAEPDPKIKPELQSEVEKQQAVMKLLTEYKKLLDNGVITQEDYDKKKNELLGL